MSLSFYAQKKEKFKRINAARVGYLTDKLDLTPEQAEKF